MTKRALPNHDARQVCLDLCHPCHTIWFDRNESVQLAPRAVIELFRDIHARQREPRRALPERLGCPRCRKPLALVHDLRRPAASRTGAPTARTPDAVLPVPARKQFVRALARGARRVRAS
jgi:hypothetical protein